MIASKAQKFRPQRRVFLKALGAGVCASTLPLASCGGGGGGGGGGSGFMAAVEDEGRAAVLEEISRTGASACSLAFFDRNGVLWSEAWGTENGPGSPAATPDTLFPCASLSKMIAAVAALRLVDRRAFGLDSPLTSILPSAAFSMPLDPRHRDITVRMLLSHCSGLAGYDDRDAFTLYSDSGPSFTGYAAQVLAALPYQRLKHDPGALCAYTNDGFTVLEALIARVAGQDFPGLAQNQVFAPLGMRGARYDNRPMPDQGVIRWRMGGMSAPLSINCYGSGGAYATPTDIAQLGRVFLNEGRHQGAAFLAPELVAATGVDQTRGTFNPLPSEAYRFGLGWDTMAQPGMAQTGIVGWQKTGDFASLGTNLLVLPAEGLGVAVFCAGGGVDSDAAVRISERILLRALTARGRLPAMPALLPRTQLPALPVPAQDRAFCGEYTGSRGIFQLRMGSDALSLFQLQGGAWQHDKADYKLRTDGWYAPDGDPASGLRLMAVDGRNYLAERANLGMGHYASQHLLAEQLPPWTALDPAWPAARVQEDWLPVNEHMTASFMDALPSALSERLHVLPGRSDYLVSMGNNAIRSFSPPMADRLDAGFLRLPYADKDIKEAAIESWQGQGWLRSGSLLFRPASGLPPVSGNASLTIGGEGYNEWRRLTHAGRLSIKGAQTWLVYDQNFQLRQSGRGNAAALTVAADDILFCQGLPGDIVELALS